MLVVGLQQAISVLKDLVACYSEPLRGIQRVGELGNAKIAGPKGFELPDLPTPTGRSTYQLTEVERYKFVTVSIVDGVITNVVGDWSEDVRESYQVTEHRTVTKNHRAIQPFGTTWEPRRRSRTPGSTSPCSGQSGFLATNRASWRSSCHPSS
jgi:hypothetical protein